MTEIKLIGEALVTNTNPWQATCSRFIVFLDIMGFRERVSRETHQSIYLKLLGIKSSLFPIEEDAKKKMGNSLGILKEVEKTIDTLPPIVMPLTFSDSIILVSGDESLASAQKILFDASWVMQKAVLIGLPMKGGVAYGEQTSDFNNAIHFGQPLIDAYEIQNDLQFYGVVLHHTMEQFLTSKGYLPKCEPTYITRYTTPFKQAKVNHFVVSFLDPQKIVKNFDLLYQTVSGLPRLYADNTLEFLKLELKRTMRNEPSQKANPS
jgi:hypothetical protein